MDDESAVTITQLLTDARRGIIQQWAEQRAAQIEREFDIVFREVFVVVSLKGQDTWARVSITTHTRKNSGGWSGPSVERWTIDTPYTTDGSWMKDLNDRMVALASQISDAEAQTQANLVITEPS